MTKFNLIKFNKNNQKKIHTIYIKNTCFCMFQCLYVYCSKCNILVTICIIPGSLVLFFSIILYLSILSTIHSSVLSPIPPSTHLIILLFFPPSIHINSSIFSPILPSIHPFIYSFIHLFIYQFFQPSIHLFFHSSFYPSINLFFNLFAIFYLFFPHDLSIYFSFNLVNFFIYSFKYFILLFLIIFIIFPLFLLFLRSFSFYFSFHLSFTTSFDNSFIFLSPLFFVNFH